MGKEYSLTGGAQEWLRRIALNRPLAIVPDAVAVVLIDIEKDARAMVEIWWFAQDLAL